MAERVGLCYLFFTPKKDHTIMGNGSLVSYACVAAVAAALSAGATMGIGNFVGRSFAQTPAAAGTIPLLTQPLADLPGREVRITLLDREPGNSSPPHHHPGHHTFGYVVEGTYELGINGQPTRILKAGDVFYEPPGAIHSMSHNASADKRLKIVVFMVADQNNPSTVNEK
jgi:quercetin dioxygenase-like cupin family protein